MLESENITLRSDASELVLSNNLDYVAETYLFEPAPTEKKLGRLMVAGETEARDGIGKELLDLTIQALQKEYYRDVNRTMLSCFESALHQANLVLHDAAEQGLRDWMGFFHIAVGVLANGTLHISTAGHGTIFLVKRSGVTELSADLSYSPITEPLRTFSQVASGNLGTNDSLLFGSSALKTAFSPADLMRISIDHSAQRISARLEQLYEDQQLSTALAIIVLTISNPVTLGISTTIAGGSDELPRRASVVAKINPRTPLIIQHSVLRALFAIIGRLLVALWHWVYQVLWPLLIRGSRASGRVVAKASVTTSKRVSRLTQQGVKKVQQRNFALSDPLVSYNQLPPRQPLKNLVALIQGLPARIWRWTAALPKTSKLFAILALVLTMILIASLALLQSKRAEDAAIQQASEILHDARTKADAAQTALIFDNRDQARNLITEAQQQAEQLALTNFYVEEVQTLRNQITTIADRLQRIARASTAASAVIGDFSQILEGAKPKTINIIADKLYTFNPTTNSVLTMGLDGATSVATQTTSGIGFLDQSVVHAADKTIIFTTDTPGVALFDSKNQELSNQDISYASKDPNIIDSGTYGSRLYLLDRAANNIFSFSKSLSGYGSGSAWITEETFPKDSIASFSVDGTVFTLHTDGTVRQLYKGTLNPDFTLEPVDPPLAGATKIITNDSLKYLYIFDPSRSRVVVYDKKGELQQQIVLDITPDLSAIAISPDETTIYALDGSRVLAIPLTKEN